MKWAASIRNKITIIIVATSLITMSVGFSIVGVQYYSNIKESIEHDGQAFVQGLINARVHSEKTNDIRRVLQKNIQSGVLESSFSLAIFDGLGNLLAQAEKKGGGYISQVDFKKTALLYWNAIGLHIYKPVKDESGVQVAVYYLRMSPEVLQQKLSSFLLLLLFLLLMMVIVAMFLARKLQKYISTPLLNLQKISQQVSEEQNYALRVPIVTHDEIGQLTQTFNDMLETIENRQKERNLAEQALQLNKRRLERAVKDLQYLANYDSLTELPNRALCIDRMRYALKRASRTQTHAAILFLDLDNFKDVNDSLGHAIGDELLKATSQRLKKLLRDEDTLARLGGDEFVIILNDITNPASIAPVVEKLVESFSHPFDLASSVVNSRVSVGVCVYPNDGQDVDTLMKAADAAMYKAKEAGRNTYAFYKSEMNDAALRRHRIGNYLRTAIADGQLSLVYQPQVDLKNDRIIGAEALIRWTHPELGFISPTEFIPIAESTGLIKQIGNWVIEVACTEVKSWRQRGLSNMKVGVNLSALQFRQSELPEMIGQVLERHELPPEALELELTEGILMKDVEQATKTLYRLKRMGIKVAVDDFGTGYSSLSYLRRFPLDSLKIDRSFVDEVCADTDDTAITMAIISMAKSLRLKVIAEGVESIPQRNFLAQHGCDEIQGYWVSKGLTSDAFFEFACNYHNG